MAHMCSNLKSPGDRIGVPRDDGVAVYHGTVLLTLIVVIVLLLLLLLGVSALF